MMALVLQATLMERIMMKQVQDRSLEKIRATLVDGRADEFHKDYLGVLRFRSRLCVPVNLEITKEILKEAHRATYSLHLGGTKMYKD